MINYILMSGKNPWRLKVLSLTAILLIGFLQYYVFKQNEQAILRGRDLVNVEGRILHHDSFKSITVEYYLSDSKTNIQVERMLDNNYDPFKNIDSNQAISISYYRQQPKLFYVNGYDDIPSSFVFYFITVIGLFVQIVLIAVLVDYMDNNLNFLR